MGKLRIDFDEIDEAVRSKITKGSVIPRPIAWITTLNETGSVNLAPFSYFNVISPTLFAVSIRRLGSQQKDTLVNLLREKEAVIHIVDESLIAEMDQSSIALEVNESEVDLCNLTLSPSVKIKTPGLEAALVRFEVVLEQSIPLLDYDKENEEANLVILRAVASVIDDKVYDQEKNYILTDQLRPIGRLGGSNYTKVEVIEFTSKR
jgi:flavin reductase (DIM6/NTAB) family NADH-FMN oxidoreductase RutF